MNLVGNHNKTLSGHTDIVERVAGHQRQHRSLGRHNYRSVAAIDDAKLSNSVLKSAGAGLDKYFLTNSKLTETIENRGSVTGQNRIVALARQNAFQMVANAFQKLGVGGALKNWPTYL